MPYYCKYEETTEEEKTALVEGLKKDPEEKILTLPKAALEDNSQESFPPFVVFALG